MRSYGALEDILKMQILRARIVFLLFSYRSPKKKETNKNLAICSASESQFGENYYFFLILHVFGKKIELKILYRY